ncbi:MAG: hypothetical protein WCV83_02140 [Candidatus Magasanikbacteria bacterium]
MNFFFNLFPHLPWGMTEIIVNVVAMIGVILHIYGVFLEKEKRRDLVFVIGGTCLFVYSLWIQNKIFSFAMAGFTLASLVEYIEILTGHHLHNTKLVEDYKHPNQ